MKKLLFLYFTIILTVNHAAAINHWAIVIGISEYPTTSGWRKINGANDIGLIVPTLERCGFPAKNIETLSNSQATKQNIYNSIMQLSNKVKAGDVVYFHFSGHGQLITDINGDEGNRGWDSSIIPYDAQYKYNPNGYKGENHITDDELNTWMHKIKKAIGSSGRLLIVLDACHSGGGSRGDEDYDDVIRGVSDKFEIPQTTKQSTTPEYKIDWVCVSACKWAESNYEHKGYGRLSRAIAKVLNPSITAKQLDKAIENEYSTMPNKFPQTAEIETDKIETYSVL